MRFYLMQYFWININIYHILNVGKIEIYEESEDEAKFDEKEDSDEPPKKKKKVIKTKKGKGIGKTSQKS